MIFTITGKNTHNGTSVTPTVATLTKSRENQNTVIAPDIFNGQTHSENDRQILQVEDFIDHFFFAEWLAALCNTADWTTFENNQFPHNQNAQITLL